MDGEVVGHVALSRAVFEGADLAVLGPIAVVRSQQSKRVGSALMRAVVAQALDSGFAAIVLIGHPGYYPRFGFRPCAELGLSVPYDVPLEVAMVLPLRPEALSGAPGLVRYPVAFGGN